MRLPVTGRRKLLRGLALASVGVVGWQAFDGTGVGAALAQGAARPNPDQALQMLLAGNARYVATAFSGADRSIERRVAVAGGRAPFAAILSCADSRVPPELVFDAGLGDLFVVRVAGNVTAPAILGSIEYAVEHLHVPW